MHESLSSRKVIFLYENREDSGIQKYAMQGTPDTLRRSENICIANSFLLKISTVFFVEDKECIS